MCPLPIDKRIDTILENNYKVDLPLCQNISNRWISILRIQTALTQNFYIFTSFLSILLNAMHFHCTTGVYQLWKKWSLFLCLKQNLILRIWFEVGLLQFRLLDSKVLFRLSKFLIWENGKKWLCKNELETNFIAISMSLNSIWNVKQAMLYFCLPMTIAANDSLRLSWFQFSMWPTMIDFT